MNLFSVDFRTILTWLKEKQTRIKVATLGGNSYLFCEYVNYSRILIIGSTGQYKIIGARFWNQVCRRMDSLNDDDRQKAGKYADIVEWRNPDQFFAPSVPAICKAYIKETQKKN